MWLEWQIAVLTKHSTYTLRTERTKPYIYLVQLLLASECFFPQQNLP